MKLTDNFVDKLRCPVCTSKLEVTANSYLCLSKNCRSSFPIVDEIPIILSESSSIFSPEQIILAKNQKRQSRLTRRDAIANVLSDWLPSISLSLKSRANYELLGDLLAKTDEAPAVLVLGSGLVGQGLNGLLVHPGIKFVETDVYLGPRTNLICDAHSIPFEDNVFDGVIIQAVLEHVLDPYRCVEEIQRVLKKDGLVYAETPFMQQVHEGRYDFTRFTHLGHRRLFRHFEELSGGAVAGPGMALAWSYKYFLLSFARSRGLLRSLVTAFAHITAFWLKYFDYFLIDRPGTLDAASGFYFLGRKSTKILSDKELIMQYRGLGKP